MNPLLFAFTVFIIFYLFWYFICFIVLAGLIGSISKLKNHLGAEIKWLPYPLRLGGEYKGKKFCISMFYDPRWFMGAWFWDIHFNYHLYGNFPSKSVITRKKWEQFCEKQNIPENIKGSVNNLFNHGFDEIKISPKQIKLSRSWSWLHSYDTLRKTELNLSSIASAVKVLDELVDLANNITKYHQDFQSFI